MRRLPAAPKKYIEKVGDEGFKKAPIGAGPYKLTSHTPGVELVLDAHEKYWRKTPTVKRLVWKTVTEDSTRLAMLKRGEVDVAYSLRGPLAEEVKRTPELKLVPTVVPGTQWLDFGALQWDPKSPWHDRSRSEEHTSELQSQSNLVCRLLLEKKKKKTRKTPTTRPSLPDLRITGS